MVKVLLLDMEFEKIMNDNNMAIMNTVGTREHVTDTERGILTMKESARCIVYELCRVDIKVLPKQVIIHPTYFVVMWINAGPNENGIS